MATLRTRAGKGSALTHNELDANFKRTVTAKTTTYTVLIGDNRSVIEGLHATVPFTITLGVATDMDAAETGDYEVTIANVGAADVTVAPDGGGDTIDGLTTSLVLSQYDTICFKVNSAGDGYSTIANNFGEMIQIVNTLTGANATGTTTLPLDDTIPQNTEGNEFMTLAITPNNTANILKIEVVAGVGNTATNAHHITALFQDSTADALAAVIQFEAAANVMVNSTLIHYMTAGTVSATTFKVRCGSNVVGTESFNGALGGRYFGGIFASSITITEYKP